MSNKLTEVSYLKELLAQQNIVLRRESGQHFLVCEDVVEATINALQDGPQNIAELGAGIGTLTVALLKAGFNVRAIEHDRRLINVLMTTAAEKQGKLEVVAGDLRRELWVWDSPYQLVGNIPYNLSGLIVRKLTQLEVVPERVVLLVQREVGERLMAKIPDMHLLSVAIQLWGRVQLLKRVPRGCFWPPPQVDSELVLLTPHQAGLPVAEREQVMAVAKHFFRTRRKQMGGGIRRLLNLKEAQALELLTGADIRPEQRPQEITISQWIQLTRLIEQ